MNPADMDQAELLALALELGNASGFQHLCELRRVWALSLLEEQQLRSKVVELVAQYREAHDHDFDSQAHPDLTELDRADLIASVMEFSQAPQFQHIYDLRSRYLLNLLTDQQLRGKVAWLIDEYREAHDPRFNWRRYPELADMDRRALIVRLMEFRDFPLFRHIYDLQSRRLLELLEDDQLRGKVAWLNDAYREAHD